MAFLTYWNGIGAVSLRLKARDSTRTDNGGLTGVTNASAGLRISAIADNESASTSYTQAGGTIDTITTLGTWVAPTAGHCRLKLVDDVKHPGLLEVQFENSRWAVGGARYLIVTILGVANMTQEDHIVQLPSVNLFDSTNGARSRIEQIWASTAGKVSGAGSGTETFLGFDGATAVLTITVDSVGNRTAIVYG
jgi:hypothetical protein